MTGTGEMLRDARESRGVQLDEAARDTRIRIEYLAAIEENDFGALPGDVYTRGFLRNYSTYLGVDPATVLAAYEGRGDPAKRRPRTGALAAPPPPRRQEPIRIQPLSPTPIRTRVRYAPSFWLVGLFAFVLLIAGYLFYNAYTGARQQSIPTPTVVARLLTPTQLLSILPTVLVGSTPVWTPLATPSAPVTRVAAAGGPQPTLNPNAPTPIGAGAAPGTARPGTPGAGATVSPVGTVGNGVTVQVQVGSQNAWMKVDIDGKTLMAQTLGAGTSRTFTAQNTIRIRFARADITSVTVNGADKGLAGDSAQTVVTKEWDATGNERIIP